MYAHMHNHTQESIITILQLNGGGLSVDCHIFDPQEFMAARDISILN